VPLPIRLPAAGETGQPFDEWLLGYVPGRATRDRLKVLYQQWDRLRDDLGREPTVREYAKRWQVPEAIAYRAVSEFRRVLEAGPGELADLLWQAVEQQQHEHPGLMVRVLGVRVVER
jgi:hypothetical protein